MHGAPVSSDLGLLAPVEAAQGVFTEGAVRFRDGLPNMYGGHVLAHALWSALLTTDMGVVRPHSLHAHFVEAARPETPLLAHVSKVRDGRSFALRRVDVVQSGRTVLLATVSSHREEPGDSWPAPRRLDPPPEAGGHLELATPLAPFDVRAPNGSSEFGWPRHPFWVRSRTDLPDDGCLHAAVLAYISDAGLVWASRGAGTRELPEYRLASLDHALWIHRPPRVDTWLRFDAQPVVNEGARSLTRASLIDEDGQLVATVVQEALLRPPRTRGYQRQRCG